VSGLLAIVGLPGAGKTTLAKALGAHLGLPVLHSDEYNELPWEEQADAVLAAIPARGIVEGVTVPRLFRRGFAPDAVVYILGGTAGSRTNSLRSGIDRGLREYGGRVITVPHRPALDTVLWALGQREDDE
jgi:adenylate kinase family enzyme